MNRKISGVNIITRRCVGSPVLSVIAISQICVAAMQSGIEKREVSLGKRSFPTKYRQVRYRVRLGKIFYPEKLRVSQFHCLAEHLEQSKEDRDLDYHRQTSADRIDAVLLVKLHHLLVHAGRVVFVFVP